MALLRESRAPAVMIEPGFLTHPTEGARLQESGHQEAIVNALTDAVAKFLTGHRTSLQLT
ncbi:MAG: N-acetylmuramoyl-L-alanine amidase [Nitriliruptorales bacterium]